MAAPSESIAARSSLPLSRAVPWRSVEHAVDVKTVGGVDPLHLGVWTRGEPRLPVPHGLGALLSPGVDEDVGDPQVAQHVEAARAGKEGDAPHQVLMSLGNVAAEAVGDGFPV